MTIIYTVVGLTLILGLGIILSLGVSFLFRLLDRKRNDNA